MITASITFVNQTLCFNNLHDFLPCRYAVPNPYEQLKAFTRGQQVTQQSMMEFVDGIEGLPAHAKDELKKLTPGNYIGNAVQQARSVQKFL